MFTTWHAGAAFASAMVLAAALSLTVSAAGCRSAPLQEGPAGPVAVMPGGSVAQPPAVTGVPAAVGCPAAPCGARFYAPGSSKTVALTFDDGPGKSTAAILAILARYRVPATFFNIGVNMAPRPALVRAEVKGGYAMGNHTWNHPDMAALPAERQAAELDQMSAEQRSITGTVPCAFRPPYGATTRHAHARAAAPDGRVAVVGRHPGLDGRRLGLLLLGTPHHPAGRAGGRRPAGHAQRSGV